MYVFKMCTTFFLLWILIGTSKHTFRELDKGDNIHKQAKFIF